MRLVSALSSASIGVLLAVGCAVGSPPAADQNPSADGSTPPSTLGDASMPPTTDAAIESDAAIIVVKDTLTDNRDRLLASYFAFLEASAVTPQTNGLSSGNVSNVCDVWTKIDPSTRNVFLTLTARLQGSHLGADNSSMLSHVTKLYRVAGGQASSPTDPGSCGGGEFNRMIMSMDATLHDAQLAASTHQGARQSSGNYDIADSPAGTSWRNSQDLGGPHTPFDLSDETEQGAPRGQTQYFTDPTSAAATSPLGRQDLSTLVDPYALEMDQDYDCVHNSNPICSYVTYGPLCAPETSQLGTAEYVATYGDFGATWKPTGCP